MNRVLFHIYLKLQEAEMEEMTTSLRFSSLEILNAAWEVIGRD